jgi:hypothetical protein
MKPALVRVNFLMLMSKTYHVQRGKDRSNAKENTIISMEETHNERKRRTR